MQPGDQVAPAGWPVILVVDDEEDSHELVRLTLQRARVSVVLHKAWTGREALTLLLGEAGGPPGISVDLVLLDMMLPDISGTEVLQLLRATPATASTPVVVQTGNENPHVIASAFAAGADAALTKGTDFLSYRQRLLFTIQRWIASVGQTLPVATS